MYRLMTVQMLREPVIRKAAAGSPSDDHPNRISLPSEPTKLRMYAHAPDACVYS